MSLIGALTKAVKAGETAKKTAPFYSAVDEALANIARPKGTGAEFFTELSKQAGVKKAELADRKLEQAFKAKGKMTKEEAIKLAGEHPPPKLREEITNDLTDEQLAQRADDIAQSWGYRDYDDLTPQFQREVDDRLERMQNQYGDYQLPGGQNYREIKMKLPSFSEQAAMKMMELEANQRRTDPDFWRNSGDAYRLRQLQEKKAAMGDPYLSSHWKGEPNVLAHMRVSDRVGPDGQKILHVEEIQSDWHQAGRQKGYRPKDGAVKAYADYENSLKPRALDKITQMFIESGTEPERAQMLALKQLDNILSMSKDKLLGPSNMAKILDEEDTINSLWKAAKAENEMIPDAPFKKNWHELAMKRLLNYAADNGYDSIAITPGAEQAKRYDLSKQVDELLYKQNPDGTFKLSAQARGSGNMIGDAIPAEKLEDYVGKDVAQKIIDNKGAERNLGGSGSVSQPKDVWGSLSGEGLQVGGEGMKGFYDQMLPSYLNQFGKPYGSQVGIYDIDIPKMINVGHGAQTEIGRQQIPLHNFPITPEMRESIKQKGTPLYQQIGIPTAGAGAASQLPEPEEGLAGGGIINSLAKTEALAKLAKLREQMAPRAETVQNLMKMDESRYLRDVTPDVLTKEYIEQEVARMKARAEASQPEVKKADGGAINYNTDPDMSDGGTIIQGAPFKRGGKVNITTNRDAMFMELSNKKLKRK